MYCTVHLVIITQRSFLQKFNKAYTLLSYLQLKLTQSNPLIIVLIKEDRILVLHNYYLCTTRFNMGQFNKALLNCACMIFLLIYQALFIKFKILNTGLFEPASLSFSLFFSEPIFLYPYLFLTAHFPFVTLSDCRSACICLFFHILIFIGEYSLIFVSLLLSGCFEKPMIEIYYYYSYEARLTKMKTCIPKHG